MSPETLILLLNLRLHVILTLDFYNQINMLYGTVTEFCTPTECPVMNAGIGQEFPKTFKSTIQSIVRRLFRVYDHLYNRHFAEIYTLGIKAHLNTSYRHFFFFIDKFDLIKKDELIPLEELNASIISGKLNSQQQQQQQPK
ncbi:Mitotic exit network component [Puccinia graminis f. sp. tritici]|uniref:Mitotic exit network component n=1 Tax=Puccinia graminis f. sp. tritici TaxID=56615 RepID=A0A5B0N219_PUCGR|nr:Mitotic exit network component [Puccinia graminis f. sp. tritici]KAA1131202.1 Mitotic exit network component [Puccinia graminis f. sp. tritici]